MATTNDAPSYLELSDPLGGFLVLAGVAIWGGHHAVGLFTGWVWALFVGGFTIAAGLAFLRPGVRLYQYELSPLDAIVAENDADDR